MLKPTAGTTHAHAARGIACRDGSSSRVTYTAATALKESNALAATTVFTAFCVALERYAASGAGEEETEFTAVAVAREMALRRLAPERALSALRIAECGMDSPDYASDQGRVRAHRYAGVVNLMLNAYFEPRDDARPPTDGASESTGL